MRTLCCFFLALIVTVSGGGPSEAQTSNAAGSAGFQPLFNGRDLSGWVLYNCPRSAWDVSRTELRTDGNDRRNGWLLTEAEYGDFELRLDYMVFGKSNSGIALRCPVDGDPAFQGLEVQILDDQSFPNMKPIHYTGAIYNVVPRTGLATKPVGEWNELRISLKGQQATVVLNGTTVLDANLNDYKDKASSNPGILRSRGRIGLQTHTGVAKFRNIAIRSHGEGGGLASRSSAAQPDLVLETGGHTASVRRVLFTPDSRTLISVSEDNTARLWDLSRGEPTKVVRIPVRPGDEGRLYAGALSPDGRLLALGGYQARVYLIDLATQRLVRTLEHKGGLFGLDFSADGKLLATACSDMTAQIWDVASGKRLQILRGHKGIVQSVSFSPDGRRLATAARDGTARIWTTTNGALVGTLTGHDGIVSQVAWSPDGEKIVTGGFDRTIRLWSAEGQFLKSLNGPSGAVQSVAFTPDGREILFVASGTKVKAGFIDVVSGQVRVSLDKATNDLFSGAVAPDGKLAAVGGFNGGDVIVWRPEDGKMVNHLEGKGGPKRSVAWRSDGKALAWGIQFHAKKPMSLNYMGEVERAFDLATLTTDDSTALFNAPGIALGDLSLKRGTDSKLEVRRSNSTVATFDLLKYGGPARSCAFLDRDRVLAGTNFGKVWLFDVTSAQPVLQFRAHTNTIWCIAPSPDRRYFLTASQDETIRLWQPGRSEPVLSFLFTHGRWGNDWVAWTPEGYYAASPGGEQLMGWQVFKGTEQMPEYYPAAQFRKTLYRPDVIKRLLAMDNLELALAAADKESGARGQQPTALTSIQPLRTSITVPGLTDNRSVSPRVEVLVSAEGNPANPVTGLRLLLDGRPVETHALPTPARGRVTHTFNVELPPGSHRLSVKATGSTSDGVSEELEVRYTASEAKSTGNLYLLAIGINEYPSRLKLDAAVPDARLIEKTFKQQGNKLFKDVQTKLLLDRDATKSNILAGLDWLAKQAKPGDVTIMFYAGHGDSKLADQFYLLPVDVNLKNLPGTGIPRDTLKSKLGALPSSTLLLMDACFAGSFDARGKKKRSLPTAADGLVRELVYDEGLVVMCAAAKEQEAAEERGHGYFTKALAEGLSGKAGRDRQGLVTIFKLVDYVRERVMDLSNDEQEPTASIPSTVRSFGLARP